MGTVPFKVTDKEKGHGGEPWPWGEKPGMRVDYIILLSRAAHGNERRARAAREADEENEVKNMRQIVL
jgi:hypothetical protein